MSVYINADKRALRRTSDLPTNTSDFTACGFIKVVSAVTGNDANIFFAQSNGGSCGQNMYLDTSNGLDLKIGDGWGATNSSSLVTLTAGGSSGTNWHFVGIRGTASGAGGLKLTHKPVGSGSMTHLTITNSGASSGVDAIQLGDLPFGSTYFGDLLFAHWMIYDRALSDGEMATQAAQGSPASLTDLLSYHDFDDTDVNTAAIANQGSGTFSFFNTSPIMSTDMPVFSADPVYSGTVAIPSVVSSASNGIPPPLLSRLYRK